MAERILVVVDDLFFLAKIQETARQLNVAVETAEPRAVESSLSKGDAGAVLLDLNHRSGAAMTVINGIKRNPHTSGVPIVGFLSHIQGDLARAARAAGCDMVLARSAFSRQLLSLLRQFCEGPNL